MTYSKYWYDIPTRRKFKRFAYLPKRIKGRWIWWGYYKVTQHLAHDAEDFWWTDVKYELL